MAAAAAEVMRRGEEAKRSGDAPAVTLLPRSVTPRLAPLGDTGGGTNLVLPREARADSAGGGTNEASRAPAARGDCGGGACHGSGMLVHPDGLRIGERGPRFFEGIASPKESGMVWLDA